MKIENDSFKEIKAHIEKVEQNVRQLAHAIVMRGSVHDDSKLRSPEKESFDEVTHALEGLTYGSEEYKANLAKLQPALKHHYEKNRHHPEHHERGVTDMTLVDIVEMFSDWSAATERHADGDILKSIKTNTARFELGEQLAQIFVNTAKYYKMGKGIRKEATDE